MPLFSKMKIKLSKLPFHTEAVYGQSERLCFINTKLFANDFEKRSCFERRYAEISISEFANSLVNIKIN